jgi:phage-related protein
MRQSTELKPVIFHPAAIAAIRLFPAEVRKELGKAVFDLQKGETLSMPLSRPMPSIRSGVEELRIRDRSGIYRTLCYTVTSRNSGDTRFCEDDAGHHGAGYGIRKEKAEGTTR